MAFNDILLISIVLLLIDIVFKLDDVVDAIKPQKLGLQHPPPPQGFKKTYKEGENNV